MRVKCDWRQASKDNWKLFMEETGTKITFLTFQNIIYSFNYGFRDFLLETGNREKLPWGMGYFAITKRKPKTFKIIDGKEVIGLPVDWVKTKKAGKWIFHLNAHTEGFKFRFKWFKRTALFKLPEIWMFKPLRNSSRLLKHYITENDSQYKYHEWDLVK